MSPSEPPPAPPPQGVSSPKPGSQRRLFIGTATAALAAGAGLAAWNMRLEQADPQAVEAFFALSYPQAIPENDGKTEASASKYTLAGLRGKAVVANFWATWCPPCVEEMPELSGLAEKWAGQYGDKVAVVGIGVDNFANVQRFSKKNPMKYPLMASGTQGLSLLTQLGDDAGGLPFTLLISPRGEIVERILGRFKTPALELALQKLLS